MCLNLLCGSQSSQRNKAVYVTMCLYFSFIVLGFFSTGNNFTHAKCLKYMGNSDLSSWSGHLDPFPLFFYDAPGFETMGHNDTQASFNSIHLYFLRSWEMMPVECIMVNNGICGVYV